MRHREAWAEEERAPSREQAAAAAAKTEASAGLADRGARRIVVGEKAPPLAPRPDDLPQDTLVVASKMKAYVKARAGMNTSDTVLGPLSDHLRSIADQAIENARADGRKTVLDRDIPSPFRGSGGA